MQVERDAGAVGVDVAVGFARLPGGGKDGFAQGAFPVGAGDFALAVARQAVGDADMARHGEAVVLLQEQGAPAGEQGRAAFVAPGADAVVAKGDPGAEVAAVGVQGAVAVGDGRIAIQAVFEGIQGDAFVAAFDDAVASAEEVVRFVHKVAGGNPAVGPRAFDV